MTKPKSVKKVNAVSAETEIETLFERALAATRQRQPEIAVATLNEVLRRDPYHARARHLLGAEYAQAGKIEDALLEMSTALELNSNMPLARFQFGQLLWTCARFDDAAKAWAPLDALGSAHILNRFKGGLLQIGQGQFDEARKTLEAAIAENIDLPALNHDLAAALGAIGVASAPPESQAPQEPAEEDPNAKHILVSNYIQSSTIH